MINNEQAKQLALEALRKAASGLEETANTISCKEDPEVDYYSVKLESVIATLRYTAECLEILD